jgi:type III secretion system (T3SS) inner membrane Yop/YscD-like protein
MVATMIVVNNVRVFLPHGAKILDEDSRTMATGEIKVGDAVEMLVRRIESDQYPSLAAATYLKKIRTAPPPAAVDLGALEGSHTMSSLLVFPLTAALIGLFVAAADGVLSRAWVRAAFSAAVGVAVGGIAGFVALLPTAFIFGIGESLAVSLDTGRTLEPAGPSLLVLVMARGMAWAVMGCTAGMGQGIAMRSRKLFLNGLIGGCVGALFGGVLFDPLNILFERLHPTGGAEISRAVGLMLIGAATGFMMGLVELIARESWVRMLSGPIAGKEFILYRNPTWIGSSPKSEIYLFKDAQVAPRHAAIHRVGEHYEIEDQGAPAGTGVGGARVRRRRLKDRDRIQIGMTTLEFRLRED